MEDTFWPNTHQQIRDLRNKISDVRRRASERDHGAYAAIEQLETDVGRALLRLHSVIAVLMEKGVISQEEIETKSRELDSLDGEIDGALHPSYFRTAAENNRQLTTGEFLQKLQSANIESPKHETKQFLARLEGQESDT
jgi:multidrug resistance efflux pump